MAAALELTHHSEKIACWRAPIKYGRAAGPMEIATKALGPDEKRDLRDSAVKLLRHAR